MVNSHQRPGRCLLTLLLLNVFSIIEANGQEMLPKNVQKHVSLAAEDTVIGIAIVDELGNIVFGHNAENNMPAASAIKSAILLELFAKYDKALSSSPNRIERILLAPKHPALAHFSDDSRRNISAALSGVSIKRLGKIMIDSSDENGRTYDNLVYNSAANISIALLGGPEMTSVALHKRDKEFRQIVVNRYMLAGRDVTGDNTATPIALASLYQKISGYDLNTASAGVLDEVRKILHSRDYVNGAKLYAKGGTLHSDPVTSVRSGWFEKGGRIMNYAIMCAQPLQTSSRGKSQYTSLSNLTLSIYSDLNSAFFSR